MVASVGVSAFFHTTGEKSGLGAPFEGRMVPRSRAACSTAASIASGAPVQAHHLDRVRRHRRIDDGDLGRRYPGEQVRANPRANQTFANPAPHGAREVPGTPVRLRALANGRV
jgi:hypothetical protein